MTKTTCYIVFSLLVLQANAQDWLRKETGAKSDKVLVKYEGTLDEVKTYASTLGLELKRKVFNDWYVLTAPQFDTQNDPLVPVEVPDIHIDMRKEKRRDNKVKFIQQEGFVKRTKRELIIEDEKWSEQWHLQPTQIPSMRVYEAWESGFTGDTVQVMVIDDGVDTDHPDLIDNYNPELSYDLLNDTKDASHKDFTDGHGTNCAGVFAAAKDTNCVIGIAYKTNFSAVRLISVLDYSYSDEAIALTHELEHVDIYSNSWGPYDDGMTMDPAEFVIQEAFELSVKEGRGGKGAIHTWASGNGGDMADNCNADFYSSSMYTIAIAAVDQGGAQTFYSEACTSILTATFSGDDAYPDITTTGPNATCVDDFLGTSAATPVATGIIALTLEANPNLTWRDVQHMIAEFSNFSALIHTNDTFGVYEFYTNGAGKQVSIWSGFGLMDADAMVKNAPAWKTVPPRISCTSGHIYTDNISMEQMDLTHTISNCHIKYVEHVQVFVLYNTSFRGDVELYLLSPMSTESLIFPSRPYDNYSDFTQHTFMSVHNWGEDPNGEWTFTLYPTYEGTEMHLLEWGLDVFGTATDPLAGIPAAGTFGSPCDDSSSCNLIADGGCLVNHDVIGDNICITCTDGFHVSGDSCERDCTPPYSPEGGYVVVRNDSGTLVANYTCYLEYGLELAEGDEIRTCGSDGIWTGIEPVCDFIDCGNLTDPLNGIVEFYDTVVFSNANYTCDEGYVITAGDMERFCLQEGLWDGVAPTCSRDCGVPEEPLNGNVSYTETFEASTAVYTCNDGYIMAEGDASRTCGSDGQWSSILPVCLIDCGRLQNPTNGFVTYRASFEGSEATYACTEGYTFSEGGENRTCGSDGNWTSIKPTCLIDCGPPTSPRDGSVSFTGTFEGSGATYTCEDDYAMVLYGDNDTRTCESDGQWSPESPQCLKTCGPLTDPVNGAVDFMSSLEGANATYTCATGFAISSGSALRLCGSDGQWTGQKPVCNIDCGPLENPENGRVSFTSTTRTSEAVYTCNDDYSLSTGDSLRTCASNGAWTGTEPSCVYDGPTESSQDTARIITIVTGGAIGGIIIIGVTITCLVLHYKRNVKSGHISRR